MKKLLITGFAGFVARHFMQYLCDNNIEMSVLAIDTREPELESQYINSLKWVEFKKIDMLNILELTETIQKFVPDYVLHLASFSSVAYSWKYPVESFNNNTNIFLNLLTAVKMANSKCRILSIGSSEEYGNIDQNGTRINEEQILKPVSPYAVARVTQEMLATVFVESYNLDIVLTRSFNHIGPWQDERFVVPSFIRRIINIKNSLKKSGEIQVGDVSIVRDFLDVRDVVHAYYLLLISGKSGNIYNVCSGRGYTLSEVINMIALITGVNVTTKKCLEYIRPNDNKYLVGDNAKIQTDIGWMPQIPIEQTISDMIKIMSLEECNFN